MRKILALAVLTFTITSGIAQAESESPAVIGVLFYADWCGSCKTLDPVIEQARSESDLDSEPVLFVRLDLTDKTRSYQAGLLAQSLGLGEVFDKNAGATGYMLLINAKTGAAISRLTKTMDAEAISASVQSAITKAKS